MEHEFWLQSWREGRTGFHQLRVQPLLQKYWPTLDLPTGSKIFVPLAGKSLDMAWLAAQGYRVLGVELSLLAVQQFFAEHGLKPAVRESRYGTHYTAGNIEVICGDAFALDAALLSDCSGIYDRAALIALPPELRVPYINELMTCLPAGCSGLLITLEYQQQEMVGPPFSVEEAEVLKCYSPRWCVKLLERNDILPQEPGFAARGLTKLATAVYQLQRLAV
ncbi:thiopurine S-methyltransferase [Nitrosomonas eutropha]|uniref:thiopurine S-methyltransferase n=1 Tax=Nitrosomonas TaxID=914 RepID=UPI0008875F7A|nr:MULTISPECIES: thiopurine S-methyltransferase [Nitrosomonas]MXS79513.1 thiopurine S-methyltransferase [Nitrosomonas sp. GH22]SCX26382.1 thiopurine S-methyltransferase [Nitrosomonas eutropha]SDW90061.1 thiopurine S-methyltransferase [Nitrosomonas eutropha]